MALNWKPLYYIVKNILVFPLDQDIVRTDRVHSFRGKSSITYALPESRQVTQTAIIQPFFKQSLMTKLFAVKCVD